MAISKTGSPRKLIALVVAELYFIDHHRQFNARPESSMLRECASGDIQPQHTALQAKLSELMPGDKVALCVGTFSPMIPTHHVVLKRGDDGLFRLQSDRVRNKGNPRNPYVFYWGPDVVDVGRALHTETCILPYDKLGAALNPGIDCVLNDREAKLQVSHCCRQLHLLGYRTRNDRVRIAFKIGTATFKVNLFAGGITLPGDLTLDRTYERGEGQTMRRSIVAGARVLDCTEWIAPYKLMICLSYDGLGNDIELMDDPPTDMPDVNQFLHWMLYGRYLPYLGVVTPEEPGRMRLAFPVVYEGERRLAFKSMDYNEKIPAIHLRKHTRTDELLIDEANDAWLQAMRGYLFAQATDPQTTFRLRHLYEFFTMYPKRWAKQVINDDERQQEEILAYYERRGVRVC